jgi:hypothetical protein
VELEPYLSQRERWPVRGRHILASYDDASIVVYQAYRPAIADAAVRDQALGGGGFGFGRMSWVKPNFLWMMYRCGWATKPDQERVLAVRIRRAAFDAILAAAVPSSPTPQLPEAVWKAALARSEVRLQWDPDHHPSGAKLERRAIQLGLRGGTLLRYATSDVVAIEDVTPFVASQRSSIQTGALELLTMPRERVYPVLDGATAERVGVDAPAGLVV